MAFFDFSAPPGPWRASFRLLYLCARSVIVERSSPDFALTPKRCAVLALLAFLLPLLVWWSALGFLLDELFFPEYRAVKIVAPIFIQGGARTGTTTLHRLLAQDPQLTAITTWEIVLAPSVSWRRLFAMIAKVDAFLFKGLLAAGATACARRIAAASADVHEVQVFGAEEDEWLMMHIGAAQLLAFFFPLPQDLGPIMDWDDKMPAVAKQAILQHFTSCIKRHLYARGATRTYVSKNPTFNKRIHWLQAAFPDARFVVMTRPPVECVPSLVSYIGNVWHFFCSPRARCPLARVLTDLQPGDIIGPLDALSDWPKGQRAALANRALREDALAAVSALYDELGLEFSSGFAAAIEAAREQGGGHAGRHHYSIEDTGMSTGEFEAHFAESVARLQRLENGEWK